MRDAERLLAMAREAQRISGGGVRGGRFPSEGTAAASAAVRNTSRVVQAAASGADGEGVRRAIDTLEEMCRRQRLAIPEGLRHSLYQVLAAEVLVNAAIMDSSPSMVAVATVYNGVLAELVESPEFTTVRDTPGILRQAAIRNPSDPKGFLRKVFATVAELERDPEFKTFQDTPGILRQAAIRNLSDPKGFLRTAMATVAELERDPEFESLRNTPGMIRHAAVHNPSDPKGFLRKVLRPKPETADPAVKPWTETVTDRTEGADNVRQR
ncbi:MAG: hypothetical protein HRU75_09340 [Planctomycetia bacterium]|nr:MAG: hypothetical protein HRU75_09340 [Planctomycetia bacterium]